MSSKDLVIGMCGALVLIMITHMLGYFIYASDDFTATVESIDYYGRSSGFFSGEDRIVIRLSNGAVYNVYALPDGLKEKHTYQLQWQRPYLLGSERLVIVGEVKQQ